MKKVMIFIPSLAGGGAERTIVNIIKFINKSKFKVTLVLLNEVSQEYQKSKYLNLIEGKCEIIYLNGKLSMMNLPNVIFKLANCIRKEKPDVLFSTRYKINVITYISKLLSGIKPMFIVRESTNRSEEGISWFSHKVIKFTYNKANWVIALSKGVSMDLEKNFDITPDKIKLIYNPVDVEGIQEYSNYPDNKKLINKNEKIVISVGRLFEQKDFPTLIQAFKIVSEKVNAKLIILGQGPLENKLKEMVSRLKLDKQVSFLGFKENPYSYMKKADLFVLSSRFEGFGHVIAEAMAVGTPVVSSNCKSGPSEILNNGEYGRLFEVGDYKKLAENIVELLNDEDLMKEFSRLGVERARFFDAKNVVTKYEELF